jgi:protein O-mannosyl-transferase
MRERGHWFVAAAIALLAIALYLPVAEFGYINYDDHRYVSDNERIDNGLTSDNIRWAFTTFELANWHPLTWLSYMLDAQLFGPKQPGASHVVNVVLHALNAAMLLIVLRRLTSSLWRSALVAALFAVHPLHVESVVWISERKDVLSTAFGLIAILFYARYARSRRMWDFALTVLGLALSLLAKPMLVTMPVLLLMLDYWPLQRFQTRREFTRLIIEKWPLILLCALSCIVTVIAQNAGGALRNFTHFPLEARIQNAIVCYGIYLWQTVWPASLAVFYPHPGSWSLGPMIGSALVLALLTFIALKFRRRHPHLLFGWMWFLISLVPVIGLVQVGGQAHADRYTYIPLIGIFVMIAWSLPAMPRAARFGSVVLSVVVLSALIFQTRIQMRYWRDDRTLAEHTLRVTGDNEIAHLMLGNVNLDEGDFSRAAHHFESATRRQPNWADAYNNLGNAAAYLGDTTRAMNAYQRALALEPGLADAHYNYGVLLHSLNLQDQAITELNAAIELDPHHHSALVQLGAVLRHMGRLDEAMARLETAVALRPDDPIALMNLADVQAKLGKIDEARASFRKAARLAESSGFHDLRQQSLDRVAELESK